jgi:P27 family predicted phage terminase small subunit
MPTKLKKLAGNPGCRRLNDREPQPVGDAVCPDFLSGAAKEEFERVLTSMPPSFFTSADVPTLAVYACAWTLYRGALARVARDGMTLSTATGEMIAHPAMAILGRQAEIILRASDRLGMSPSARSRLTMPDGPSPTRFGDLFGGAQLRVVTDNTSA